MIYDFFSSPPNYMTLKNKISEMKKDFPFLQVFSIGKSILGRDIQALGIGNLTRCNLFCGAFHGSEWLTTSLLIRYLEHLSLCYSQNSFICGSSIKNSLKQKGLIIVPMVNPDGVSIAQEGAKSALSMKDYVQKIINRSNGVWQANARGVDINHNFDAGYAELKKLEIAEGIIAPSNTRYGGVCFHSEPESKAVVGLVNRVNTDIMLAFHSQGEEIFYEYGDNTPAKSKYLAYLFKEASDYQIVLNQGLYSHGGFKDYYIDKLHKPGFTIEIGKGKNPLPITDLEDIYERVRELMLIATVM